MENERDSFYAIVRPISADIKKLKEMNDLAVLDSELNNSEIPLEIKELVKKTKVEYFRVLLCFGFNLKETKIYYKEINKNKNNFFIAKVFSKADRGDSDYKSGELYKLSWVGKLKK